MGKLTLYEVVSDLFSKQAEVQTMLSLILEVTVIYRITTTIS